jgi:hypothetical protein
MPHSLPANLRLGNLHSATVADYAPETDTFIFAAIALPVFDRPENSLAEEAVLFRFETPVINSLRFGNFAE